MNPYSTFALCALITASAASLGVAKQTGDIEPPPTSPAVPTGTPWGGAPSAVESAVRGYVARFKASKNDDAVWANFRSAAMASDLDDLRAFHLVQELLQGGVSDAQKRGVIFSQLAIVASQGFPGEWSLKPFRLELIRKYVVTERLGDGMFGELSPAERGLVRSVMLFLCASASEPDTELATRINAWSGWTMADRQAFGATYLANARFVQRGPEVLGRTDDGLEPVLLARIVQSWNDNRWFDSLNVDRLLQRGDTSVGPFLATAKAAAVNGEPCGAIPCSQLLPAIEWADWQVTALQADKKWILDAIANDPEGSAAYGYARGDEKRLFAVDAALRKGIDPGSIREAFLTFVSNLKPGLSPYDSWSRVPGRNLGVMKGELVRRGVLSNTDLPDVPVYSRIRGN